MNNNKSSIYALFSIKSCVFKYMGFLFSIALFSSVSIAYAEADLTISASYDTYFSNKSKKAKRKNYDDKPALLVKRGREATEQGYIRFNVADIRGKETVEITLNVFVTSFGKAGRRLVLEKMDPNALSSRNNWKNRPVRATSVGSVAVNSSFQAYKFNVTHAVNRHIRNSSSDNIVFRLKVDGKNKANWVEVASLEGTRRDRAASLVVDLRDRDDDGVPDTQDAFPDDPSETKDKDGDGIGNNSDNCRSVRNPDQANQDGDSAGDACDAFPTDPTETLDTDGDGVGDNTDAFPADPNETTDTDSDGVGDNGDNCPVVSNSDQANQDGDSAGDVCDAFPADPNETTDTDSDGVGDNSDNCPDVSNADQTDEDGNGVGDACEGLTQYTPTIHDWTSLNEHPFTNPDYAHEPKSHAIDSPHNHWFEWTAADEWDGVTLYNPQRVGQDGFSSGICLGAEKIRGLKQLYDAKKEQLFPDPINVTKAQMDEWHRLFINHLRVLTGLLEYDENYNYVGNTIYEVKNDVCVYARTLWSQERHRTTIWNSRYPEGRCLDDDGNVLDPNPHCGASFIPSYDDQKPYLPVGHRQCGGGDGGSEGVTQTLSGLVWPLKIKRAVCSYMPSNTWDPHAGPFFFREKIGLSFRSVFPEVNFENAQEGAFFRNKGSGTLYPNFEELDDCGLLADNGKMIGTEEQVLQCMNGEL